MAPGRRSAGRHDADIPTRKQFMTTTKSSHANVVVVDGSNIATEGRSLPSLTQLQDAVMAFREEHPAAVVTVVVDATFGHRIDKKEAAEFDEAVAHNEVVAPPAGAIGRGDAFVLSIANKVGARILSNDSFQEFHGEYPWLFDEGRLIGGKPVPHVGWVFVERLPVKGPISRKATRTRATAATASREAKTGRRSASREASQPMPVPSAPPPGRVRSAPAAAPTPPAAPTAASEPTKGPPAGAVNELLPFIDFVERHPIGSSVNGVVDSYSSHGAYVAVGDVRGYLPLRLMGSPPPRSAREMIKVGDAITLVVFSFAPARRSIDLALPQMAPGALIVPTPVLEELAEGVTAPPPTTRRKRATTKTTEPTVAEPPAPRKRGARKAAAAVAVDAAADTTAAVEAVEPRRSRAKKAVGSVPAESVAPSRRAKKAAGKQAAAPTSVAASASTRKKAAPAPSTAPAPAKTAKAAAKAAAKSAKSAKASTATAATKQVAPARKRKAAAAEPTVVDAPPTRRRTKKQAAGSS